MSRPLSIGLNLTFLTPHSGGSAAYASGLIGGLRTVAPRHRIVAFVADDVPLRLQAAEWHDEVEWARLPILRDTHPRAARYLLLAQQWATLPTRARVKRLDVIHGLANVVPPVALGVPTVVTLHDVIWIHFPESMSRGATARMRLAATASVRTADRVLTVSSAARDDISATLRVPTERIDVAHLAADTAPRMAVTPESELRVRLALGEGPIVLCVAQKRDHKNLDGLIRAFADTPANAKLLLPGAPTPYEADLRALTASLGLQDRILFLPWLSDSDLEGLYALASCFVLPSWIEGFGLPILDAMHRGVPVACSAIPSLSEVAGGAALLFDPADPHAIAQAITRLLSDRQLSERLISAGEARARSFSWEKTAEKTLESYERAIRR